MADYNCVTRPKENRDKTDFTAILQTGTNPILSQAINYTPDSVPSAYWH